MASLGDACPMLLGACRLPAWALTNHLGVSWQCLVEVLVRSGGLHVQEDSFVVK